jgi:uncharacterized protein (UPF0261 family)
MATQNIIQYLETTQYNALPSGGTVPVGKEAMNRRQIETFIAGGVIAANDLVCLDLSATGLGTQGITVVKANSGALTTTIVVGFALSAAAAGDTVDVTIAGLHESGKVAVAIGNNPGSALTAGATAGEAALYVNTDIQPIIGYCMGDATSGVTSVFVIKQM